MGNVAGGRALRECLRDVEVERDEARKDSLDADDAGDTLVAESARARSAPTRLLLPRVLLRTELEEKWPRR